MERHSRELTLDRRRLIKLGLSSGLLAALPTSCVRLGERDASALFEVVAGDELPREPERTGKLERADFDTLAGLCEFVDRGWSLEADLGAYRERLRGDLDLKTSQPPSYLSEYESAVELIGIVGRESATTDLVWATLLFSDIDSPTPDETRLGRARRLVFGEIVTHQVALSGGFRSFGLVNYAGWVGGPFTDEGSYRRGTR